MSRALTVAFLIPLATLAQPLTPPPLRLSGDVRPIGYAIELRLDPAQASVSGRARESGSRSCARLPPSGCMPGKLAFTSVRVAGAEARAEIAGGDFAAIVSIAAEPPYKTPLEPGATEIEIEYTGTVSRVLIDGLFAQRDNGGWHIFSKFEPVTARRAFPCFEGGNSRCTCHEA